MKHGPVWFDFENTPHVLFLEPLLRGLTEAGYSCLATSRQQAQTVEVAAERDIAVEVIGQGDRTGLVGKVVATVGRARRLHRWAGDRRPCLLVSSSRSASLAARLMGVPGVGMLDYEHAEQRLLALGCGVIWLPDVLEDVPLPRGTARVARFYPGLKENLYLDDRRLEHVTARRTLGLEDSRYVVVARPPAETAHYSSGNSLPLWIHAVRGLTTRWKSRVIVVARTAAQRLRLAALLGRDEDIRFLDRAVDGPLLVSAADLVVGGGGTMNREAAVLGIPVWSVFTGPAPAIDNQLASEGRLTWLRDQVQVEAALRADPPGALPPRGPFPEGRTLIMRSLMAHLES